MHAAQDGHTKVVEVLLQNGASVDLMINVSVYFTIPAILLTTLNCSCSCLVYLMYFLYWAWAVVTN